MYCICDYILSLILPQPETSPLPCTWPDPPATRPVLPGHVNELLDDLASDMQRQPLAVHTWQAALLAQHVDRPAKDSPLEPCAIGQRPHPFLHAHIRQGLQSFV